MVGYKDMLLDLPDSEYEEAVGFLNDTLADDAETIRQWQDEMARMKRNEEWINYLYHGGPRPITNL